MCWKRGGRKLHDEPQTLIALPNFFFIKCNQKPEDQKFIEELFRIAAGKRPFRRRGCRWDDTVHYCAVLRW